MINTPEKSEIIGQNPDAVELFNVLESLDSDQKKFNYLRDVFLEEVDVDEYLQFLEEDEELDLTRRQISKLKTALTGYKPYLKDYLELAGKRIEKIDEGVKEIGEILKDFDLAEEEIVHIREQIDKVIKNAISPRGAKGKSLRKFLVDAKNKLFPEGIKYLSALKGRFDELKKELKHDVKWSEVEKTLRDNPEAVKKLMRLDEAGFEMNVFGEKDGEIVFRTAQRDATKIAKGYREIMYDRQAEIDNPEYKANGNAVDLARDFGVELADHNLYKELRLEYGFMWLKTDDATRRSGYAFDGSIPDIVKDRVYDHNVNGSFCPALRVKKS